VGWRIAGLCKWAKRFKKDFPFQWMAFLLRKKAAGECTL
jgi:hypothetical protein